MIYDARGYIFKSKAKSVMDAERGEKRKKQKKYNPVQLIKDLVLPLAANGKSCWFSHICTQGS